jgi:YggT family protein
VVLALRLLALVVQLYWLVLLARMVLELALSFSRDWRPRGAAAVAAEIVYTVTDPPLKLARRFLPPLRLGPVSLDLAFTVVFIVVTLLGGFLQGLPYMVQMGRP